MSAEKLSLAEKKAVKAAIERARGTDKKGKSAQSSIPYQMLRPDGICQVTPTHFTKTIQFRDINYQLSDNEDKQTIFDSWCDFLNYFDSSVRFQLSFLNLTASEDAFVDSIQIPDQGEVWNRVTANRFRKAQDAGSAIQKATRYYMDEFHLLLKEEQTAAYSIEIWKRFRKWGGIPTGITQNVKDLLASREIANIFENSDFIYCWESNPTETLVICSSGYGGSNR